MRIWVDADACPGAVRDIVLKAANRLEIPVCFVANKELYLGASALITSVRVPAGPDVVDQYIVDHAKAGDLVVTQDIPLAAQLIPMQAVVMSPHGRLFTTDAIGEALSVRNAMQDLRDVGLISGGPKPFGEKEKRQFANTFDQQLTRLLRERPSAPAETPGEPEGA